MKLLLQFVLIVCFTSGSFSRTVIEKVNVKILDASKGKCVVQINPGPPTTVDIDAEALFDAQDLTVRL